jgi:hypothetical protein
MPPIEFPATTKNSTDRADHQPIIVGKQTETVLQIIATVKVDVSIRPPMEVSGKIDECS